MLVRSHMTMHSITLRRDIDCRRALDLMHEHALQHLPVLDDDNRLAGIVVERDLLRAVLCHKGASMVVEQLMHRDCVSVFANAPVTHAATLMARHAIGGMPVLDGEGRVIGIITETAIFRAFVGVLEARTARAEISPMPVSSGLISSTPGVAIGSGRRVQARVASVRTRKPARR